MEKNYRAHLTGVFGDPVDGNPTGVMEEAAYAAKGLNFRYITMQVKAEDLEAAFAGAKAMHFDGFNLTMPHKIKVIPLLDRLTEAASIIGAVNTVYRDGGDWVGENTDGKGFVQALTVQGVDLHGKRVTILGAGGAARAIGVECALAGASSITVINRNETRGRELAQLIDEKTPAAATFQPWVGKAAIPAGTEIVIQATCVGLHPHGDQMPEVELDTITAEMVVCDVVFNPVMPRFLQEAQKRGAQIVTGIGMLVQQGARNFTLWTGEEAPTQVMYETLEREFAE